MEQMTMADRKPYKTDVTDAQWQRLYPLIKRFDPEFKKGPPTLCRLEGDL